MEIGISIQEIIYAAIAALVITWIVEFFLRSFRVMFARTTIFEYKHSDFEWIVNKCYSLFPKDAVLFKGRTYSRGETVRIITLEHKVFEGSLVGQNYDNMICLLTRKYIITHDLSNIKEMNIIE
ncbi:MAG: hypothetical protein FWE20_00690 [Defluviitaleaceae bacterium]|nr:hypothetical protein [Defluviitaleaceae bacterium]